MSQEKLRVDGEKHLIIDSEALLCKLEGRVMFPFFVDDFDCFLGVLCEPFSIVFKI